MRFNVGDENGATRNVTVPIIGDEVVEPDETFSVSLIPQHPERDLGTSVTITVIDDDSATNRQCKVSQVKDNSHALVSKGQVRTMKYYESFLPGKTETIT